MPNLGAVTNVAFQSNNDVIYGLYKNVDIPSWYQANRSRLLVNAPLVVADGRTPGGFMGISKRAPLAIEQFNCMALAVNRMKKAFPVNFIDNCKIPTSNGVHFVSNYFVSGVASVYPNIAIGPAKAFCAVGPPGETGSQSAREAATILSIPVHDQSELPDSWLSILAGVRRKTIWWISGSSTASVDLQTDSFSGHHYVSLQEAFGSNTGTNTPLYWINITDVRDAAEALGFLFIFRRITCAYKLEVVEGSASILENTNTDSRVFDGTNTDMGLWANFAALLEIRDVGDLEFVGTDRPKWRAAGVQTYSPLSFAVVPRKQPDVWTNPYIYGGNPFFTPPVPAGHTIFQLDIDERLRGIKVVGDTSYHSCYRDDLGGGSNLDSVLVCNYSSARVPSNDLALAFGRSTNIPDSNNFSTDVNKVLFMNTGTGTGIQEKAYPLTAYPVPVDPSVLDLSSSNLAIPVNRDNDEQVVSFSDFTPPPGINKLQIAVFADNMIDL